MSKLTVATGALVVMAATPAFAQRAVCVDFEPPLVSGSQFGAPAGNVPGDRIPNLNNVPVTIQYFKFPGPGAAFNVARVETPPVPFGSSQTVRTNNINLLFDFSHIGFVPQQVQFEFLDLGGAENISVNGVTTVAGELSAATGNIGGAALTVTTTPVPGGKVGKAILRGTVISLTVGGQEFWIDHVCASRR